MGILLLLLLRWITTTAMIATKDDIGRLARAIVPLPGMTAAAAGHKKRHLLQRQK